MDSGTIGRLIEAAKEVRKNAYAPFSGFKVGAAVLAGSGRIYTGVNVENSSYGLTICAERVAVFKAVSEGERVIRAVAIYTETEKPTWPCGACRQVLLEFAEDDMDVISATGDSVEVKKLSELLPEGFRFSPEGRVI